MQPALAQHNENAPLDALNQALSMLDSHPSIDSLSYVLSEMKVLGNPSDGTAAYHALMKAVYYVAGSAQDPDSPVHIQHWTASHFHAFRDNWSLCVQSPSTLALNTRLCDLMLAYAKAAGARPPNHLDDVALSPAALILDLSLLDRQQQRRGGNGYPRSFTALYEKVRQAWPRVGAYWRPSWDAKTEPSSLPVMTAEVAREAWAVASQSERVEMLQRSDLDWLGNDIANKQLAGPALFKFDRLSQFSSMSDEQFMTVLHDVWHHPDLRYFLKPNILPAFASLPAFAHRAQLVEPIKAAINGFLAHNPTLGRMKYANAHSPVHAQSRLLALIAGYQPTCQMGRELIHDVVDTAVNDAIAGLQAIQSDNPGAAELSMAKALIALEFAADTLISAAHPAAIAAVAADRDFVAAQVRRLAPLLSNQLNSLDHGTHQGKNAFLRTWQVPQRLSGIFLTLDQIPLFNGADDVKSALVESGLVALNDLRVTDLTPGVLYATLTKHPERRSEFQDPALRAFVASMFAIPLPVAAAVNRPDPTAQVVYLRQTTEAAAVAEASGLTPRYHP